MFQETLLESSPISPRRRGWPMATAFTFQMLMAGALVVLPLLSTGIIPITSPSMPVPLSYERPAADPPHPPTSSGPSTGSHLSSPQTGVVSLDFGKSRIGIGSNQLTPDDQGSDSASCLGAQCGITPSGPPNILPGPPIVLKRPDGPVKKSHMDPGMLMNRVIPEYPAPANRTGVQGEVKLHAIIARDGTIQSLSVISGHPMLTGAAIEAVRQWRYRPYVLNGEPVEVDTYITVTFHRN